MNAFKTFAIIVIFVALAGVGIYFAASSGSSSSKKPSEEVVDETNAKDIGAIFFYGSTCPHCKKVEEYFDANKVRSKIKIELREVYGDKNSAALMQEKQNQCKELAEEDKGGVPFLYTPNKCIVGDQPIIEFFEDELKKL